MVRAGAPVADSATDAPAAAMTSPSSPTSRKSFTEANTGPAEEIRADAPVSASKKCGGIVSTSNVLINRENLSR
jgi:hypothetical protein